MTRAVHLVDFNTAEARKFHICKFSLLAYDSDYVEAINDTYNSKHCSWCIVGLAVSIPPGILLISILIRIYAQAKSQTLKHGVLTTYNEMVFLRNVDSNRQWALQYSTAISTSDPVSLVEGPIPISLSQSLYHVALSG